MTLPGDGPLHPRPQLTRPRWTDLCGAWGFALDPRDAGLDEHWHERDDVFDRTIIVPFPPESPASGIDERGYNPVVWYRRTFTVAETGMDADERLLLHFGAVDYRARVWVDGRLVAVHEGGHTPFSADITSALDPQAEEHVITVRAEDPPLDVTQPRGKQDWMERPHAIWYERTTGIWQPVWLEPVPKLRVDRVHWSADLDRVVLRVRVSLEGPVGPAGVDRPADWGDDTDLSRPARRVRVRLTLHGDVIADDVYAVTGPVVQRDIALDGFRISHHRRSYLWSPDHPNLVDATVTLLQEGADGDLVTLDEVGSYAGLRSVESRGERFVLNSRPFALRMVLAQNYWPQSHLAAPEPDALRREVELVKEMGFNGVRIHQKVEDPRFLAWCDRLGVLAWGELPSPLDFEPMTVQRLTREWLEVLERDASSPALVAWVPFNESWGVPNMEYSSAQRHAVRGLYHLTKSIDPSRLVIGNDGWEHLVADIFGIHDYATSGQMLRERYGSHDALEATLAKVQPYYRSIVLPEFSQQGQPLMITEFGGITFDPDSEDYWNGYGAVSSAQELLDRYDDLVTALLESTVVAGFCYTQLTDTGQERNGLLDENRRPKVDPALLAAVNRKASAAVPADAIAEIQIVHAARISTEDQAGDRRSTPSSEG